MAKKKVKDIVAELLVDFLAENDLELFNVEFVKEGRGKKPATEDAKTNVHS